MAEGKIIAVYTVKITVRQDEGMVEESNEAKPLTIRDLETAVSSNLEDEFDIKQDAIVSVKANAERSDK